MALAAVWGASGLPRAPQAGPVGNRGGGWNNKKQKIKESRRVRGYLSSVDNALYFGLGNAKKIDTIKVFWPSGKYEEIYNIDSNTTLTVVEKNTNRTNPYKLEKEKTLFKKSKNIISFKHSENTFNDFKKEILLPYKQSSLGPFITKGDANGDGIDDIYIGGAPVSYTHLTLPTKRIV